MASLRMDDGESSDSDPICFVKLTFVKWSPTVDAELWPTEDHGEIEIEKFITTHRSWRKNMALLEGVTWGGQA